MLNFINTIFGYPLGWVMWLCYKVIPVYGVALIVFTVIVRLLLVPLAIKQQKSMVRMQVFQPQMQEIQKKYANNKQKMNEEMMKLYQQENYNPMSGCLPMAIQLPILFGLIDVIYKPLTHILRVGGEVLTQVEQIAAPLLDVTVETLGRDYSAQLKIIGAVQQHAEAFAGVDGGAFLQQVGSLNLNFLGIDLTQTPTFALNLLILVPILSGLTSVLMSVLTLRQTSAMQGDSSAAAVNSMNKSMLIIMPIFSAYFAFVVPAGVGIYWIISNLLSALQSFVLNKVMNPKKLAAQARAEMEARREKERQERIEAKRRARERGEPDPDDAMSKKRSDREKLAAARKRDAEKYGEVYKEVTDEDLR